jgi:hypothetical protein
MYVRRKNDQAGPPPCCELLAVDGDRCRPDRELRATLRTAWLVGYGSRHCRIPEVLEVKARSSVVAAPLSLDVSPMTLGV